MVSYFYKPYTEEIKNILKETIDRSKIDLKKIITHRDCAGKYTSQILIEFLTDQGIENY